MHKDHVRTAPAVGTRRAVAYETKFKHDDMPFDRWHVAEGPDGYDAHVMVDKEGHLTIRIGRPMGSL